jgi:hypothetical protein
MARATGRESSPPGESGLVLQAEAFRSLLRGERGRSDRSGRPFSVVAFQAPARAGLEPLLRRIAAEARLAGAIGWLPGGELALLLRGASVADAAQVARDLCAGLGAGSGALPCTLYGHPPFRFGSQNSGAKRRAGPKVEVRPPREGSAEIRGLASLLDVSS